MSDKNFSSQQQHNSVLKKILKSLGISIDKTSKISKDNSAEAQKNTKKNSESIFFSHEHDGLSRQIQALKQKTKAHKIKTDETQQNKNKESR